MSEQERADVDAHQRESLEEIEAERERRLAPENRPENAVVDNTDATLPTVEAFEEQQSDDAEGVAGTADPSERFREIQPSQKEIADIEAERERRLAPENRPENAVVDNTGGNAPEVASEVASEDRDG